MVVDRNSTRPFLEDIEKRWLAFQLLCAVRDCHSRDVFHGDIKTENTLVTSWNWLYLSDFSSSFKPTYLPEDNPADFSFYFDIAGRRTCYLAPERFLSSRENTEKRGEVTWAMDIFSVGCVIAELFLETPIFNLSQLFKYRKGEYDPGHTHLSRIEDPEIREMVTHMIQIGPESRYSADEYLNFWRRKAFPEYFYTFLHQYMHLITDPTSGRSAITASATNLGESDERINRVYYDFDKISYFLDYDEDTQPRHPPKRKVTSLQQLFPLHLDIPNKREAVSVKARPLTDDGSLLFLNVITSSLRSTARATARIRACELLLAFAERMTDEAKLDRVLPFVMYLLGDGSDIVKVAALRTLTQLVALVSTVSPVNAYLFPEYILRGDGAFKPVPGQTPSPLVRITYASCVATLAESASRFLDVVQALKADGTLPAADRDAEDGVFIHPYQSLFDVARADLVRFFETQATVLLTDDDPDVRRAFMSSVSSLCIFFGNAKANDVILSHLITFLNDKQDWRLRYAFCETIIGVATFVGGPNVEEFILPSMIQALSDPEESVVERVLRSLSGMAQLGLFQRSKAWELVELVGRFAMHPNIWIREAAASFISSAVKYASLADTECIIKPIMRPYMRVTPATYSELNLLDSLKRPLSRITFDMAVSWATKGEVGVFWKAAEQGTSADFIPHSMPAMSTKALLGANLTRLAKHDEDQQWVTRLRNAGMSAEDDIKLLALREHIWRTANRKGKEDTEDSTTRFSKIFPLSKLGIAPETVFFGHGQEVENTIQVPPKKSERSEMEKEPQSIADALLDASAPIHSEGLKRNLSTSGVSGARMIRQVSLQSRNSIPQVSSPLAGSPAIPVGTFVTNEHSQKAKKGFPIGPEDTGSPVSDSHAFLSPNDRLGLVKHNHTLRHRGSAIDLMQRKSSLTPTITKAEAEISTSSANVLGRVDGPSPTKEVLNDKEEQLSSPAIRYQGAHTYNGRDPNVLRLLDALYLENRPMNTTDFGPAVTPIDRRQWEKKGTNSSNGRWRPEGNLVAMFNEHTAAIVRVLVAPDHSFFITGSEDGCVKVWDCARLERNLAHRSKQTYRHAADAKITSICFVENTHSFVSAASDGSVHVVRVDYAEITPGAAKYGKLGLLREYVLPDPSSHVVWLEHFIADGRSTLLMATQTSQVHALDLKTMTLLFTLENPIHHGQPTCFCVDTKHQWLLLGTSHGILDLWDLRFRLRVRSWGFAGAAPIHRVCLHPIRGTRKKQVVIAGGTGTGDVTIWDLEKLTCKEVYRIASTTPSLPGATQQPVDPVPLKPYTPWFPDASPSATLLERFTSSSRSHPIPGAEGPNPFDIPQTDRSVRALCTGYRPSPDADRDPRHGFLIAGGPDGKVRFWDLDRVDASCVVSGLEADEGQPGFVARSLIGTNGAECVICEEKPQHEGSSAKTAEERRGGGKGAARDKAPAARPSRSTVISLQQLRLMKTHLDSVLDVALVEYPVNMVVSVDRSGAVYVFQ